MLVAVAFAGAGVAAISTDPSPSGVMNSVASHIINATFEAIKGNATNEEPSDAWVYTKSKSAGVYVANRADQEVTWRGADNVMCYAGDQQSPINIEHDNTTVLPRSLNSSSIFHPNLSKWCPAKMKNTGHSFQLHDNLDTNCSADERYEKGTSLLPRQDNKGGWMGHHYNFVQVHWHTPSEHTVDGEHAPLEAHFVHALPSSNGTSDLGVLAVLFDLDKEESCNNELAPFWNQFDTADPDLIGKFSAYADLQTSILEKLAPHGFYHWQGSLTTPPCTEGVNWNLFKARLTVCSEQLYLLKKKLSQALGGVDINNRVVQPLNGRAVYYSGPDAGALAAR